MKDTKQLKKNAEGLAILYVEDDKELRNNTERLLSTFFEYVETADNGQIGLDKYKEKKFDIVISDINMPYLNGIEMTREIMAINENQTVIITSAYDESKYLIELINLNVHHFILKPLDINQFLTVLDKAVHFVKLSKMETEYIKQKE